MINLFLVMITVTSVNCALDKCSSCGSEIKIDGRNYSPKQDGLNLVAIHPNNGTVHSVGGFLKTKSGGLKNFVSRVPAECIIIASSQVLCQKESGTNLKVQKAILNGFQVLGAQAGAQIQPFLFRSGVTIYSKRYSGRQLQNATVTIDLPFSKVTQTNQDPVWISFGLIIKGGRLS